VRRRKPTLLGIIGSAVAVAGVIGLAWGSFKEFHPDRVGIALLVLGAILICYKRLDLSCKRLEQKNLAADEIFNVGREQGETAGYDEGYREGVEEGRRHQPRLTVVPLRQRCSDCGNSLGLKSVGSVADRG
jgi:hypothetical protein